MGEEETRPPQQEPIQTPAPQSPIGAGIAENTWAMVVHLAALSGCLIPFGNIIGPLLVWVIKKDELPSIDRHGKAALNFNISISIYVTVASIVSGILVIVVIGAILLPLVMVAYYVFIVLFPILAGMKANEGGWYDYPMTIQFIK